MKAAIADWTRSVSMLHFEEVVLRQQPASKQWLAVTDYSLEARRIIEGPHAQLIRDVLQPKTVLDVGCGPGHLVTLLKEVGVVAHGVDVHPTGKARYMDITQRHMEPLVHDDVVICREVLEHLTLRQVRTAIENLCELSSRLVYITTRFSSEHDLLRVETSDTLDPTHITLPAKDLYRVLLTLEGFKRRGDLEVHMDHRALGRCLVYERV